MADVAVVILCSDGRSTVVEAVDSVVAQTRPAAEIVVIDNGWTDLHTRQRLESLSRPRLRVVQVERGVTGPAGGHAVVLAAVPYVLLVDPEDTLEARYLEETVACLDLDRELGFVSTAVRVDGEITEKWTPAPLDLTAAITQGRIPSTALLRRQIWDLVGGFDEELPTGMALDFWITVLELGFRGGVIDEPLLRRRGSSSSSQNSAGVRSTYRHACPAVLRKHRTTIERLGPQLLMAKEDVIREQQLQRSRLEQRASGIRAELGLLDDQIAQLQRRLREQGHAIVDFGDFWRLDPVSPVWGLERGRPVDRYYIERFLAAHRSDIRGRVLEIKEPAYADKFGSDGVTARDVLDVVSNNPRATIVADLTRADAVPSDSFDCFILTQTLHIIYDVRAALFHAHRILKPGGVLLASLPAVSRINYEDGGLDGGDFWRFTEALLARLFGELFSPANVKVLPGGNLKACLAFLYGLAADEVPQAELDHFDPRYPLVFCVRAVKPVRQVATAAADPGVALRGRGRSSGAVLMYHRISELQVDPHRLCVSPREFKSHMQYLVRQHPVLSLEDLARAVVGGDLPEGAIAVTFDDGTLDALDAASPILMELGIPATFFVNTERLDEEHEPWWDVLGRVFLDDAAVPASLSITLGGDEHVFAMRDAPQRAAAYTAIHRWLMRARLPEREETMARVAHWSGMALPPRRTHRVLLSGEIRRLAERPGHTLGSHSVHHLRLTSLPAEERDRQIRESRQELERLLGRPVTLFSYPFGAHDQQTVELVKASGFRVAVTTEPCVVVSGAADVYALPRLDVKSADVSAFGRALEEAFSRGNSPREEGHRG